MISLAMNIPQYDLIFKDILQKRLKDRYLRCKIVLHLYSMSFHYFAMLHPLLDGYFETHGKMSASH